MKLARVRVGNRILAGVVDGEVFRPLLPAEGPSGEEALIDIAMAHRRGEATRLKPADALPLAEVQMLAPLAQPPSIRDFLAFEEHVRNARRGRGLDVDPGWYDAPVFYFTNPHVVHGPGDDIAHPKASQALDYELEVAAVVGRDGSDLSEEEAAAAIAGYTILNDFSARDVQIAEMAQMLGPAKGKDFAHSMGPVLVTPDELPGGAEGRPKATMVARVNGREYSRGELGDCHWSFAQMIAYASRDSKVRRGDVIGSGTVGTGCLLELRSIHDPDGYPWLRPDDTVEFEVAGIGVLTNRIREPRR